jgi:hypothetical protein
LSKAIGGAGGGEAKADKAAAAPAQAAAVKNLFQPEQITQAQDQYKKAGLAKWNQIGANMGAGPAPGQPSYSDAINNQASSLGTQLGQLNTDSGFGDQPMNNLDAIMKSAEGGIGAKYPVY